MLKTMWQEIQEGRKASIYFKEKYNEEIKEECECECEDECECEGNLEYGAVYHDFISQDADFEDACDLLDISLVKIMPITPTSIFSNMGYTSFYCLFDSENYALVPCIDEENRHGCDCDETFINFNDMVLVDKEDLDVCDECEIVLPKECLINIDPNWRNKDLKEEYRDFDGMVCGDCFEKFKA